MSDWIEWQGGECPVPKGTLVDVRHRDGDEYLSEPAMGMHSNDWSHGLELEENGDIVAYRICEPAKQPDSPLDVQVGGGHYKDLKIQPVEYMHANNIPFIEGCCIKYLTRWRDKGGIQDLEKVKHFVDLLIDLETRANKSTASGDNK